MDRRRTSTFVTCFVKGDARRNPKGLDHVARHDANFFSEHTIVKIAAIIFICGLLLIGYGLTLPAYTNNALFNEKVSRIQDGAYESRADDKRADQFFELREKMLTPKYRLIDYGITVIMTAFMLSLCARNGKFHVRLIGSRMGLIAFAIALSFLSVAAPIFDLIQGSLRFEFPPWADSLGLVIPGIPVLIIPMLMWSLLHIVMFSEPNQYAKPLSYSLICTSNWWLLFISAVTMTISALCAVLGLYWYAIPGFLWVYFYLSLAISRQGIRP